ncbi:MAG TPA: class I SAM-dependent methyltransferase [Candidatus Sulfotelmatobacter sp.]|nr:class I SAM-dependent methyltransferase [Candidatus Sulfotelmatobacter sp.]
MKGSKEKDMVEGTLSERDRAEIERSAEEARRTIFAGIDRSQINRYLDPPADTAYALEYAFYLLGDIRGKTVLDLGCGTGENLVPLVERGARVIGIDLSPDLVALARLRVRNAGVEAELRVASAYDTGLESGSVDIVFCIALIHHLDIRRVRDEMRRILAEGGVVILKEPVRFSKIYAFLRGLLPAQENVSEFEHPLTQQELATMTEPFEVQELRYFRLPWIPLVTSVFPSMEHTMWRLDRWVFRHCNLAKHLATAVAMRLVNHDGGSSQ